MKFIIQRIYESYFVSFKTLLTGGSWLLGLFFGFIQQSSNVSGTTIPSFSASAFAANACFLRFKWVAIVSALTYQQKYRKIVWKKSRNLLAFKIQTWQLIPTPNYFVTSLGKVWKDIGRCMESCPNIFQKMVGAWNIIATFSQEKGLEVQMFFRYLFQAIFRRICSLGI